MFDKETIGSNNSLGQVNLELKYLDLDEPIYRRRYPLKDLVSSSLSKDLLLTLVVRKTAPIYWLLTKCEVKMAGYCPSSFLARLWTKTKSRSINTQKKNKLD